jgi:GNAT superfamily N-acetyltransferase
VGDTVGESHRADPTAERTGTTRAGDRLTIGPVRHEEQSDLFVIFDRVVEAKEGYPHAPPLTQEAFDATWRDSSITVVARLDTGSPVSLVGAYYLRPNFVGRAAHIANAGYVVDASYRNRGIGRLLLEDSAWRAPLLGFDAIQFNLVFESNPARRLYERLGWRAIGRLPEAVEGEDALIYWRQVG